MNSQEDPNLKQQFLEAMARNYGFSGDTYQVFMTRFNPENYPIDDDDSLAKKIEFKKNYVEKGQKIKDELKNHIYPVLRQDGCEIPSKQGKPARGKEPWRIAYHWLWNVKYPEWLNPQQTEFDTSTSESDPNFVGREQAINELDKKIMEQNQKIIVIYNNGGIGKTTLAEKYLELKYGRKVVVFRLGTNADVLTSAESLITYILEKLEEEARGDFNLLVNKLIHKLENETWGLLLDNIEPALAKEHNFSKNQEHYKVLFKSLNDASTKIQGTVLITSRIPINGEFFMNNYLLESLSIEAWKEYFSIHGINTDNSPLAEIHQAYGGNALGMKVIMASIVQKFKGNISAYWQDRTKNGLKVELNMENLIKEQFDNLASLDPNAYKLLYRMGCFRYAEEVPNVPREGLEYLLLDVEKDDHERIIEELKSRCLIEFNENEEYWLLPIVRKEALKILKENKQEWQKVHNKAAEFWTELINEINTSTDALTVFEAYYHYSAIEDFDKIGEFLCKERNNKWERDELLGYSLYRLGLFRKIDIINKNILDRIENNYNKVIICTMLARDELFKGNIKTFVEYHNKTQAMIEQNLWSDPLQNARVKILKVVSNLYFGLSYLELGELKKAKQTFNQTLDMIEKNLVNANDIDFNNAVVEEQSKDMGKIESLLIRSTYILKMATYIYLAFTNSSLNPINTNPTLLQEIDINSILDYPFNTWGKSLSLLFLGLTYKNIGNIEKAKEYIEKLSEILEQSDYIQLRAKALTSFAELLRMQEKCEEAINNYHLPSINILEEINAKCDLAEAYYQLALTYQKNEDTRNSQEQFEKAITLWKEIGAQKQVERAEKKISD